MTTETRQALGALFDSRDNLVWNRLKENPQYLELCRRQDESEKEVEELLHRFEKHDRITIRRHYEGEAEQESIASKELYVQGLRDCFKLITFLGGSCEALL